uniref:Uncharacterized protein n=1 Tax=Rhizophora mucronata TaxID=61149 RepID=A0A2P2M1V0_RHIMU
MLKASKLMTSDTYDSTQSCSEMFLVWCSMMLPQTPGLSFCFFSKISSTRLWVFHLSG